MALKNRTESKAVVTNWAPVLDLEATHKPDLRDEILDNCLFRKDVAASDTAAAGTKTIDFLDIDYIAITQSTNVTYTLNNVQQGEIKYLKITKSSGQTIRFANINDESQDVTVFDNSTVVLYQITNKDGTNILATPLNREPLGDFLYTKNIEIGDWDMDADAGKDVSHGLTLNDIREVSVMIRDDANSLYTQLNYDVGNGSSGNNSATATLIQLSRKAAGEFDNINYDSTSYNRGWIKIRYTP